MGNIVIMGRKTWDTLPFKPLKGRINIVLTRDKNFKVTPKENTPAYVCNSMEEIEDLLNMEEIMVNPEFGERKIFCIGGGEIYKLLLPYAEYLMLTKIEKIFDDADVFFPELNMSEWIEVSTESYLANKECNFMYSYINYERID